jgi:peptidoglycan/xylan/chitin deacetylase (PgdA/CDA1 family)
MSRELARSALHSLGMLSLFRRMSKGGVRILMYHRFRDGAPGLRAQCQHLRNHYHPVSLKQVSESFAPGEPLPDYAVAVTVDDGYRDFVTIGEPIFRAYDIPTTIFVVSDFLDGKQWLWGDAVEYALTHTRRPVSIDRAAFSAPLKNLPVPARQKAVDALLHQLEVELPAHPPEEHAPITWDEARALAARGVEFGAHTKTHPILSQLTDREALREEICVPKARIEAELGTPALHFCYPNGRRQDFTEEAVDLLKEHGFRTAVTTERGINFADAAPLMLRRLGVEPHVAIEYFAELMAGVRTQ